MLDVICIHVYYGDLHVVKDISLRVEKSSVVSILGANGAGKTTILRTVSGFVSPRRGDVVFEEENITQLTPYQLVKKGIVLVPEGRGIFNHLTVNENFELGAYFYFRRRNKQEIRDRMQRIQGLFPILKERGLQAAGSLSGGEQQMLAIGRALMAKPKVLLLDEPSMGLAPLVVKEIFRNIQYLRDQGGTILLVEQNARAAMKIASYVYVLGTGRVVAEGAPGELLKNEIIEQAYLG